MLKKFVMEKNSKPENALELGPGVWILPSDLRFSFSRSRGPGGQAVNKVSSRAELRVALSSIVGLSQQAQARLRKFAGRRLTQLDELLFDADTFRSQLDNKQACIDRFRVLIARAVTIPKPRKARRISRSMVEKRLATKRKRAEKKSTRRWKPGKND